MGQKPNEHQGEDPETADQAVESLPVEPPRKRKLPGKGTRLPAPAPHSLSSATATTNKKHSLSADRSESTESAPKRTRDVPSSLGSEAALQGNIAVPHAPNTNLAVADHYNARPDQGVEGRRQSKIIRLRAFNNWVKSTLINLFTPRPGASVLDMGCGKGGDLNKWGKVRCGNYVGVDIADVSIEQARQRYANMRGHKPRAQFYALDCWVHSLTTVIPPSTRFDIVSMQFCMHYCFETEAKTRMMFENVTGGLRTGGVYILTIPDYNTIVKRLKSSSTKVYTITSEDPEQHGVHTDGDITQQDENGRKSEGEHKRAKTTRVYEFGNSIYKIKFKLCPSEEAGNSSTSDNPTVALPDFGARYGFTLEDAVDDCDEFLVNPKVFESLAAEYGLRVIWKRPFLDFYKDMTYAGSLIDERRARENRQLLERMRGKSVVGDRDDSIMSDEEWEAAGIYIAYTFEKIR